MRKLLRVAAWMAGIATGLFAFLAFILEVHVGGMVTNFFGAPLGDEIGGVGPLAGVRSGGSLLDILIFPP